VHGERPEFWVRAVKLSLLPPGVRGCNPRRRIGLGALCWSLVNDYWLWKPYCCPFFSGRGDRRGWYAQIGRGLLHIYRVLSSMPCCMWSYLSDSEEEMVLLGRHVIVGASQRVFVFDPPAMHGTRGLISEAGFEAAPAAARCSWLRFPLVYWGWCILWVARGWRLAAGDVDSNRLQLTSAHLLL